MSTMLNSAEHLLEGLYARPAQFNAQIECLTPFP